MSLQAKGKERQWLRHQATGELDDAKIIDGLTGEKAIYKRRGELEPQVSNGELVVSGKVQSSLQTNAFQNCHLYQNTINPEYGNLVSCQGLPPAESTRSLQLSKRLMLVPADQLPGHRAGCLWGEGKLKTLSVHESWRTVRVKALEHSWWFSAILLLQRSVPIPKLKKILENKKFSLK